MNDLTVTKIITIYETENNSTWKRDFFDTRKFEGIIFFREGEIKYHFEHKDFTASAGDILLLPSNVPYSGKKLSETVSFIAVEFKCLEAARLGKIGAPCVIKSNRFDLLLKIFGEIIYSWKNKLLVSDFEIKSFIYTVLSEIYKQQDSQRSTAPIDKILAFIGESIERSDLSLDLICRHFYISESQVRRNIRKKTGLSPNEYINALRINKAKAELLSTSKTVKEISSECGFSSPYYFSKVFSKSVGASPSEYRREINH